MTSHADNHDRDKLSRWHQDLFVGVADSFPLYAVFLVSADDKSAHNIFRQFRASFEKRHAAFAHLIIFGQHGVSTTVQGLAKEFGLSESNIPALALFTSPYEAVVYTLPLPAGTGEGDQSWKKALELVETAVSQGKEEVDPASFPGVNRKLLGGAFPLDVTDLAGRLLRSLAGSPQP